MDLVSFLMGVFFGMDITLFIIVFLMLKDGCGDHEK